LSLSKNKEREDSQRVKTLKALKTVLPFNEGVTSRVETKYKKSEEETILSQKHTMDKGKDMKKSTKASDSKKVKRQRLSPATKRKNIDKKFLAAIKEYGRACAEGSKREENSSETDETDSDYAEFLKTYDPSKQDSKSDTAEPEPTDKPDEGNIKGKAT
jgi:hypothetical protein